MEPDFDQGEVVFEVTDIVKRAAIECQDCPFAIALVAEGDASIGFASKQGSDDEKAELEITAYDG